jgi:hypothetical protein
MRVPAAPPTPEDTGRAENAALTSRRSRSSWRGHQQAQARLRKRMASPPLEKGLAIRPRLGYSWWTRHIWVLLAKHRLVEKPHERPGCNPVFLVPRRSRRRPATGDLCGRSRHWGAKCETTRRRNRAWSVTASATARAPQLRRPSSGGSHSSGTRREAASAGPTQAPCPLKRFRPSP